MENEFYINDQDLVILVKDPELWYFNGKSVYSIVNYDRFRAIQSCLSNNLSEEDILLMTHQQRLTYLYLFENNTTDEESIFISKTIL